MGAAGASPPSSRGDTSRLGLEGVGSAGVCEAAVGTVRLGRADEGRIVGVAELTDLACWAGSDAWRAALPMLVALAGGLLEEIGGSSGRG